tara:strand:+ start:5583 stop:6134 length:552 start_codon:yes stop_codon:yes gene_type:complete
VAGETILIVEDNPLNLELISDILEAHDYQVKAATTGSEALKMVEESRPDLILMDIQLPGLDGLAITGIIKEKPENSDLPIIALTAHAMRGDEEKAREAGCDGYISKPIDTRAVPNTVRKYLDARNNPTDSTTGTDLWNQPRSSSLTIILRMLNCWRPTCCPKATTSPRPSMASSPSKGRRVRA